MTTMTKTKPSALDTIADTMRRHILDAGAAYSHRRLERGLELVLQRHVEQDGKVRWRLALGRTDVAPSEDEIAICMRAFSVPVGTEHSKRSIERKNAKTSAINTWHVAEMYWYEA